MKGIILFLAIICVYQVAGDSDAQNEKSRQICVVREFEKIQKVRPHCDNFYQLYEAMGLICVSYLDIDWKTKYSMATCLEHKFDDVMNAVKEVKDEKDSSLFVKEKDLAAVLQRVCSDYFSKAEIEELSEEVKGRRTKLMTACKDCLLGEYDEIMTTKEDAANKPEFVWLSELLVKCGKYFDQTLLKHAAEFTGCIFEHTAKFADLTREIREQTNDSDEMVKLFLQSYPSLCAENDTKRANLEKLLRRLTKQFLQENGLN